MPITEGGKFSPVDRIVSPGVFTRENDLSGVAQGVAEIGAVVLAPFPKGPGFAPTLITNAADLEEKFGVADGVYYGPYTAKEYLNEKGFVTVCRVGALTGYRQINPFVIWAQPGTWARSGSAGALNSGSSYVLYDSANISSTFTYVSASTSGSLSFISGATFTAKFNSTAGDNTTLDVNSPNGSLYNSGQTYSFTIGSESFVGVYVTSSYQGNGSYTNNDKLLQAIAESTSTTSYFSASLNTGSVTITNTDGNLIGTNITLISGSIFALRSSTGCGTQVYLKGVISGSFGKITTAFSPTWSTPADPCNPTAVNVKPRVLAVLSNTQYGTLDSSFNAPGFSGSVLNQKPATSGTYTGSVDPTSLSNFQLILAQNASLIGYYDFSLNPADSNYITNVFGNDATVGNQDDQVSGAKIEAAYLYKTFEDSIQKVNDELNSGNPGWKVYGAYLPSSSFATGEVLKFTDQYSTNLNAGDSQYGLTSAATPWILSQGIAPWSGNANPGSVTKYQLFKVHTLSDGTNINHKQN